MPPSRVRFLEELGKVIQIKGLGWANLLTTLRALLVAPMTWCITQQIWPIGCAIFVVAVATDIADGRVARATGQVSARGGLFDHSVDALFVTLSLGACAFAGFVNYLLPVLIATAFLQYMIDSNAQAGRALRASKLGRYNGIAYYVLLGVVVGSQAIGVDWLSAIRLAAWVLVVATLTSMLDRLLAHRTVPDLP